MKTKDLIQVLSLVSTLSFSMNTHALILAQADENPLFGVSSHADPFPESNIAKSAAPMNPVLALNNEITSISDQNIDINSISAQHNDTIPVPSDELITEKSKEVSADALSVGNNVIADMQNKSDTTSSIQSSNNSNDTTVVNPEQMTTSISTQNKNTTPVLSVESAAANQNSKEASINAASEENNRQNAIVGIQNKTETTNIIQSSNNTNSTASVNPEQIATNSMSVQNNNIIPAPSVESPVENQKPQEVMSENQVSVEAVSEKDNPTNATADMQDTNIRSSDNENNTAAISPQQIINPDSLTWAVTRPSTSLSDAKKDNTMLALKSVTSAPVLDMGSAIEKANIVEPSQNSVTSDSDILNAIERTMATNNDVSDVNVDLGCKLGVVSISGKVNNYVEANSLIIIAEATPGVKEVDVSNLMLRDNTNLSNDVVISAKIRGTLIREGLYFSNKLNPIKVVTFNGTVTLIGAVENEVQVQDAIQIAKSIHGVMKVKSQISVGDVRKLSQL